MDTTQVERTAISLVVLVGSGVLYLILPADRFTTVLPILSMAVGAVIPWWFKSATPPGA